MSTTKNRPNFEKKDLLTHTGYIKLMFFSILLYGKPKKRKKQIKIAT